MNIDSSVILLDILPQLMTAITSGKVNGRVTGVLYCIFGSICTGIGEVIMLILDVAEERVTNVGACTDRLNIDTLLLKVVEDAQCREAEATVSNLLTNLPPPTVDGSRGVKTCGSSYCAERGVDIHSCVTDGDRNRRDDTTYKAKEWLVLLERALRLQ